MKASIIIPVWNGRAYLRDCLDALLAQNYTDFEIIAVDNASSDDSADFVAEKYPQVRLIRNGRNLGFAGGCNVGLRAAQGDVLVLLNQDTIVQPGWLKALVGALDDPGVGVAGCKILYPDGETVQHAGGWIEWPLGLAYHYGKGENDTGQWNNSRTVEYVTGAAMAFRRDVLERVGPLDEDFWPGYFEDTDFCFRVREAGYEVWYTSNAVVLHRETTSFVDPAILSCHYHRGRLRFLLKHLPPDRFLVECLPAEEQRHLAIIQELSENALRIAYLEAIPTAARILSQRWKANEKTITDVILALQHLYQMPMVKMTTKTKETAKKKKGGIPQLEEFEFHSTIPILGRIVDRFRSAWYSVSARWAIRYLIQQQNVINKQQGGINKRQETYIRSLERRLTAENAFLAREVARLNVALNAEQHTRALHTPPDDRGHE